MKLRLGRRGSFLLICGFIWIFTGLAAIQEIQRSGPRFLHEMIPNWAKLILWFTCGGIAIVHAFRRKRGKDALGFAALCIPVAWRVVSYFIGVIYWAMSSTFDPRLAFSGLFVWLAVLAAVMVVASWPEPSPPNNRHLWSERGLNGPDSSGSDNRPH